MSTIIKAKRSSVQGKVPLVADLELGEFAINTFDGKLYIKKNENGAESIVDVTGGAGGSASYVTGKVTLSTTTADQIVDNFIPTSVRTVKYYVEAATSSSYHATEILLTHDGTDCYVTEYATIYSGSSLISFNANISGGSVRLLATPVNANTAVTFARIDVLEGGAVGGGGGSYTLPTANTTVLGGVKVDGTTITIANGVISSAGGGGIEAGDYVVRAVKNGTSQTITGGTDVVVTFVDEFDPQNWFASNKFQPTIAGYYSITTHVWWVAGSVTNNQSNIQFRKNGNTQLAIAQDQIVTGSGYTQVLSTIAYFNGSTDYVEVTAYTGNPTSQDINSSGNGTYFTAALYAYGSASGSSFSGDYNDLTNTPTIPSDVSDLTDTSNLLSSGSSVFSNEYSLTGTTTNSTETEILVGGSTRIPVATDKSVNYIIQIAARRTDTVGDYAMFELKGVAANNGGTVTDIGSVYEIIVVRTNPSYLVDARADDTNNSINIYVTGVTGHTIDWKASVHTIEV
jgi:hypothetical protein